MTFAWSELTEGQTLPARELGPVTRTDIVRYQGASGDLNPIHHDEPFAKAAGYPAPLVVGMLHAGALCAWAAELFGPANVRHVRMRWREQVWPGDVLAFSGAVVRKHERDGERRVELELTCTRHGGGVAAEAWASFVVPE
jgi:acyl dehydratase